jgi:hypothetical protein
MYRWGVVPQVEETEELSDPHEIVEHLRVAVEGEEAVTLRQSELDVLKMYLKGNTPARLYVPTADGKMTFVDVHCAKTTIGDYVIPWRSESLHDLLLDHRTYLKPRGHDRVYFRDVRELYFGHTKAFVVCTPVEAP